MEGGKGVLFGVLFDMIIRWWCRFRLWGEGVRLWGGVGVLSEIWF